MLDFFLNIKYQLEITAISQISGYFRNSYFYSQSEKGNTNKAKENFELK